MHTCHHPLKQFAVVLGFRFAAERTSTDYCLLVGLSSILLILLLNERVVSFKAFSTDLISTARLERSPLFFSGKGSRQMAQSPVGGSGANRSASFNSSSSFLDRASSFLLMSFGVSFLSIPARAFFPFLPMLFEKKCKRGR